jgi:2-C-methyl-D-erythritol 4-phosphate cytidylyltransferase
MKTQTAKQYLDLCGKPVIYHSLKAFEESPVDEIVITCAPGDETFVWQKIVKDFGFTKVKKVVCGGAERCISVKNGILAATDADYVMIHDAARPLLSSGLIRLCMESVAKFGACVPAVPVTDTVKKAEDGFAKETLDRSRLFAVQTPQCFERELILKAYEKLEESGIPASKITDDASVVELSGLAKVKLIEGDPGNIKITTEKDLFIAEMLKERENSSGCGNL